jgi:3-oxoacyl-[acyl-carrier protein] reductase
MDFRGAAALVTGGSAGIGYATAEALIARGARVAICGRRPDRLAKAAAELGAFAVAADVADERDVVRAVASVVERFGDFSVLVNNAGLGRFAPLVDTTAADMRHVWETNVLGATLCARESARHFVRRGGGHIVNVASTAGSRGYAGGSAYASSKFALSGLTECWRAELRQHNVRVMQVNPSEVLTEFFEASGRGTKADNPTKLRGEDIAATVVAMLELDDRAFVTDATVWATNPKG